MSPLPIPQIVARDFHDLTPELFRSRGVELVLLDLDNTLAPYSLHQALPPLRDWIESLKQAGLTPFLLSNNRGDRPKNFAAELNIGYVKRAKKPNPDILFQVLREHNTTPDKAALVGDQIYTDVLCARRSGVLSVVVRPISLENPLLALRYAAEFPFRCMAKRRADHVGKAKK